MIIETNDKRVKTWVCVKRNYRHIVEWVYNVV